LSEYNSLNILQNFKFPDFSAEYRWYRQPVLRWHNYCILTNYCTVQLVHFIAVSTHVFCYNVFHRLILRSLDAKNHTRNLGERCVQMLYTDQVWSNNKNHNKDNGIWLLNQTRCALPAVETSCLFLIFHRHTPVFVIWKMYTIVNLMHPCLAGPLL